MSDWQPIETAPKNGQSILLWGGVTRSTQDYPARNDAPNTTVEIGWWRRLEWHGEEWCIGADHAHDEYYYIDKPTHWMPLPAPPRDASGGGE